MSDRQVFKLKARAEREQLHAHRSTCFTWKLQNEFRTNLFLCKLQHAQLDKYHHHCDTVTYSPTIEISTFRYNPFSYSFSTFRDGSHGWRASFPYSTATPKSLSVQLNSVFQFVSFIAFVLYGMRKTLLHFVSTTLCILLNVSFDGSYAGDIILCLCWRCFKNSSNESTF